MLFAKKQFEIPYLSRFVFIFSYGFLVSFFSMVFGEKLGLFVEGVPGNIVGLSFVAGMIMGWFLEKLWLRMEGINRELMTALVLFLFTAFLSIVGLAVGATLAGNGVLVFEWAGLDGYESAGLVFGCVSAFLGLWIATRALLPTSSKMPWMIFANGVLMLLLLFLGDRLQNPNLVSLSVLAMPALTLILRYGFKF